MQKCNTIYSTVHLQDNMHTIHAYNRDSECLHKLTKRKDKMRCLGESMCMYVSVCVRARVFVCVCA